MISREVGPSRNSPLLSNYSFSNHIRNKKHLKNSDLAKYIDSCLFQNKKLLPALDKTMKKMFPFKLSKPIHTLNVPAMFPNTNNIVSKLVKKEAKIKKKAPAFAEMRKHYKKIRSEKVDVSKSLDDYQLMNIKGSSD